MRKFTKGLLLTFVASAMSVSVSAQDAIQGYFRIINAGYLEARGTGVMNVTSPTTAQPRVTKRNAITMPGTVMYLNAEKLGEADPQRDYVDVSENDLNVINLRSQAVDAQAFVYGNMVDVLRRGFTGGLIYANGHEGWGLTTAEINQAIEEMFQFMKMYLEPTTDSKGNKAYYLKSTTPDPRPLANILIQKGKVQESESLTQDLWNMLYNGVESYCTENQDEQLWNEWDFFFNYEIGDNRNRIHMGHTYYLIGGIVKTNFVAHTQNHDMGRVENEFISFANKNTVDYPYTGYTPEIEIAGDFSKWYLEEIVPGTETNSTNYFAVNGFVKGLDNHYYSTIYVDFPMQIVQNGASVAQEGNTVRVWGIPNGPAIGQFGSTEPDAWDNVGYVTTIEYTDIVPARTPVVVECKTTSYVNNLLQPVGDPVEADRNKSIQEETDRSFLRGIFFEEDYEMGRVASDEDQFTYHIRPINEDGSLDLGTKVNRKVVRVFNSGKNSLNPLGFFKHSGDHLVPNRAFMILDENQAYSNVVILDPETYQNMVDGIVDVKAVETEKAEIYDIQGRQVSNPTKGLYIVNGKKVVIK